MVIKLSEDKIIWNMLNDVYSRYIWGIIIL